jgi:hypothetical protein
LSDDTISPEARIDLYMIWLADLRAAYVANAVALFDLEAQLTALGAEPPDHAVQLTRVEARLAELENQLAALTGPLPRP